MFDYTAPDGKQVFESSSIKPGIEAVTYKCEDIIIGCAIFYNLRFPELFQVLTGKGVQLIDLPAAFTLHTGKDHWEALCRARAIETQAYFCAPGQTGTHMHRNERRQTWGHSMVVDPWGHVVAKASDGVDYVTARIEPEQIAKVQAMIPVLQHKTFFE